MYEEYLSGLTRESILDTKNFEMLDSIEDSLDRCDFRNSLMDIARRHGMLGQWKSKEKVVRAELAKYRAATATGNLTKFPDQPFQLQCGEWICDGDGVQVIRHTAERTYSEIASPIPIMPTAIMRNAETGCEKIELSFYKNSKWNTLVCERSVAASSSKIVMLADSGIEVTSENAKLLVKYIGDMVAKNMTVIPRYDSYSRMGWLEDGSFIPYDTEAKFDGERDYANIFKSITARGTLPEWRDYVTRLRARSKHLRLMMAAAFASPLVEKAAALPFVLHFYGTTGNGKTVAMMVAASIFGDPSKGSMWRTLNGTTNALSSLSAFFCDLPCMLDELQTVRDQGGDYGKLVMQLTEGIERGRMSNTAMNVVRKWNCAYLFTGEEPITNTSSGGGVVNRVVEVESTAELFEDPNAVAGFVREHYGCAGVEYIRHIKEQDVHGDFRAMLADVREKCDTTDKQATAAALILLGDFYACRSVFIGETALTVEDIKPYLASSREVDTSVRAYEWVIGWVAQNGPRFDVMNDYGEVWGRVAEENDGSEYVLINKGVLEHAMSEAGFAFGAVKRKWAEAGVLVPNSQGRYLHHTHCNGVKANYIKIKLNMLT